MSVQDNGGPGRRDLLKCMAWAGTGALWTVAGGSLSSVLVDEALAAPKPAQGFSFVQVSDSHVGFDKAANPDARATFRQAVAKIKALPDRPDFILHTGDISHLSKDKEFDDADQIIGEAGLQVFHIPGEHDMLDEGNGAAYLARYGKQTQGDGWFSFDHKGVHFVGLINVKDLKAGGMGYLGLAQLDWLKQDLVGVSSSTPVVVLGHIPLWTLYPQWGWGTEDSEQALTLLRRFGSVTVLNGHIHQVAQKLEGNISFHTARSTAFPQPAPGTAPAPGPMTVPAGQLGGVLGIRDATFVSRKTPIALIDQTLA
jgi:3',5'-cyclic AMP phosphodiesterase CpdA